jgi:hypothetical protein
MNENLATYLNDHLAGSVAASSLIEDLLAGELDASLRSVLTTVQREISEEQDVLRKVMRAHGMPEESARKGLAWLAEKLSLLKLGGKTKTGDCLPVVMSLEMLYLGITGKLLGWEILANILGPKLDGLGVDIGLLQSRAEAQRNTIDEHRLRYAIQAFGRVEAAQE